MKSVFVFTFLFSCVLLLHGYEFAVKGKAQCVIAYPDQPAGFEKQAAEELGLFLGKMSGAKFQIVPESGVKNRPAVYVGQSAFAARKGTDFAKLGKEEWLIRDFGRDLAVTGGRPVGSFYGVWNILNKLGCWSLTPRQMAIPEKPTLRLAFEGKVQRPFMPGRMIYDSIPGFLLEFGTRHALEQYLTHLLRSGSNGGYQGPKAKPYYSGDLFNFTLPQAWHTLCFYVDPDIYFKDHPEYFAMDESGKRVRPRTKITAGCLCMTNPDVRRITLESLRKFIQKDRKTLSAEKQPVYYDISILDVSPKMCLCPVCKAFAEKHGPTGLLIDYINSVAKPLAKEYPGIRIRTAAYSAAASFPRNITPEPNVLIQIVDQFPTGDCFRPLTSKFNDQNRKYAEAWGARFQELALWDYWNIGNTYFNPPRVETILDTLKEDILFFRKIRVRSMFIEAELDRISPQNFMMLNYFVASALMMDPGWDVELLVRTFMESYYGPCAPVMTDFLNGIRDGIRKHPKKQTMLTAGNWDFFTPEFAVKHYLAIHKVIDNLPEDNIYRLRAEMELITPVWAALIRRVSFASAFKKAGISMDQLKLECEKLVRNNNAKHLQLRWTRRIEEMFQKKFSAIAVDVATPEKFKDLPAEKIRVLAWPQAFAAKQLGAAIVADPESASGKAVKSSRPDPKQHGARGMFVYKPHILCPATRFTLSNVGYPGSMYLEVTQFPADEKYRWYKLPRPIDLQERSCFWAHGWAIQFDTTPLYVRSDGIADNNVWECFFHAKFTGPAYVPGSSRENAIYVDYVVMVRPGLVK